MGNYKSCCTFNSKIYYRMLRTQGRDVCLIWEVREGLAGSHVVGIFEDKERAQGKGGGCAKALSAQPMGRCQVGSE